MLRRTVNRVEPQRRAARIPDIMSCASGNNDGKVVLDLIRHPVDIDDSRPFLDAEELVAVRVDLFANFVAGLESHRDELEVVPGVKDAAEVLIFDGPFLDIVAITLHGSSSLMGSRPH